MRKPLIAGNWKMHKTINEAVELVSALKRELFDFNQADIVVCPPFTALDNVHEIIMDTNIKLGAQNLFYQKQGAFTGEVSPAMIKDCGCEYAIIGHSERRKYFGETDTMVNKRIQVALEEGFTPIFCVGETLEERENNKTIEVIDIQLKGGLENMKEEDILKIVIAYEPVWAIGTGKTATPRQAEEVHMFIRKWIEEHYSSSCASMLRILYGGSVKAENIKDLMKQENIDGALVGGASLNADAFVSIVKNSSN
ncbi:MAG: triose-phosphate isomerase [Candidatus Omnitrophica bacterium]|nr:triose-phosphate isomerase [Candidatus Omnitrophota bacterium]